VVAEASKAVEASITKLMDEFRFYPFAHRGRALTACRFFELLREWDLLRGWHELNEGGFKGQVIHKEWPETNAELEKGAGHSTLRCGAEPTWRQASVRPVHSPDRAAIVIELGLGYWCSI